MSYQASRFYARTHTCVDYTTGTVRYTTVLGGDQALADSARTSTPEGRLAELFRHQEVRELRDESKRFLEKGA